MENQVAAPQAANGQAHAIQTTTAQRPSQADLAAEMRTHIVDLRAETLVKARTHGSGVNINGLAHDLKNLPDKTDHDQIVQSTINRLSQSDQAALKVAMEQPDTHPGPGFLQRLTRRIEGHIGENFSEAFAQPFGPSREFMKSTDELPEYLWPVQALNNTFYRGGGTMLDAVGRTIGATYNSVVDTGVDTVEESLKAAGFESIPEADRLRRDLKAMPEAFAGSPSTVMSPTALKVRAGARPALSAGEQGVKSPVVHKTAIPKTASVNSVEATSAAAAKEVENFTWLFTAVENEVPNLKDPNVMKYLRENTRFVDGNGLPVESTGEVAGGVFSVPHKGEKLPSELFPPSNPEALKNGPAWYIHSIALKPEYRGKGLAPILLNGAYRDARRHGFPISSLEAYEDNIGARKVYAREGYTDISKWEETSGGVEKWQNGAQGRPFYYMLKQLGETN